MNARYFRCLVSLLAVSLASAVSGAQPQGKNKNLLIEAGPAVLKGMTIYGASHALLIGVNQYPNLPKDKWLDYAVNDVKELREVLTSSYGFPDENVKVLTNGSATKANILKALHAFADSSKVKPQDRILVYFSGHGQDVPAASGGDMGFVLPYDAKVDLNRIDNAAPFLDTCIKMESIWDALESTPAKHALFIADSCYSGLAVKTRAFAPISEKVLRAMTAQRAMQVITAGRKGEESLELARYGHGVFTYKLLELLKSQANTPGLAFTVTDVAGFLKRAVSEATDGKQNPIFGANRTEGEFVFITSGAAAAKAAATPAPQAPGARIDAVDTVARVEVNSTPAGAKIYVDGEVQKKVTPTTVEIDLGIARSKEVEIGVALEGYKPAVRKASLTRGDNAQVAVTLSAAPSSPASAITEKPESKTKAAVASGHTVAVIPTVNLSKEKVASEKEKQAAAGTEEMTKQFVIRGFRPIDSSAVAKAVLDAKADFTNRDSHNKPVLLKIGGALDADYVAFAVINDVGQRSNIALLTSQKEGRAQLTIWVLDVKSGKALLDGAPQEGKSARGTGYIFQAGSPRIVSAVGNAIKAAFAAALAQFPVIGDKKD